MPDSERSRRWSSGFGASRAQRPVRLVQVSRRPGSRPAAGRRSEHGRQVPSRVPRARRARDPADDRPGDPVPRVRPSRPQRRVGRPRTSRGPPDCGNGSRPRPVQPPRSPRRASQAPPPAPARARAAARARVMRERSRWMPPSPKLGTEISVTYSARAHWSASASGPGLPPWPFAEAGTALGLGTAAPAEVRPARAGRHLRRGAGQQAAAAGGGRAGTPRRCHAGRTRTTAGLRFMLITSAPVGQPAQELGRARRGLVVAVVAERAAQLRETSSSVAGSVIPRSNILVPRRSPRCSPRRARPYRSSSWPRRVRDG